MSGLPSPSAPLSLASPTIVGPAGANFVCLVGTVHLLPSFQPPAPGSVVGILAASAGTVIPLVQTNPAAASGVPLRTVNRQLATLCGDLISVQGQLLLDVRFASRGISPTTPGLNPLLLPFLCRR